MGVITETAEAMVHIVDMQNNSLAWLNDKIVLLTNRIEWLEFEIQGMRSLLQPMKKSKQRKMNIIKDNP